MDTTLSLESSFPILSRESGALVPGPAVLLWVHDKHLVSLQQTKYRGFKHNQMKTWTELMRYTSQRIPEARDHWPSPWRHSANWSFCDEGHPCALVQIRQCSLRTVVAVRGSSDCVVLKLAGADGIPSNPEGAIGKRSQRGHEQLSAQGFLSAQKRFVGRVRHNGTCLTIRNTMCSRGTKSWSTGWGMWVLSTRTPQKERIIKLQVKSKLKSTGKIRPSQISQQCCFLTSYGILSWLPEHESSKISGSNFTF